MPRALCSIHDIPEGGAVGIDDERLIAFKRRGRVYLYRNVCPHQGTPLNWMPNQFMDAERRLLQCSTHDARFEPESGLCVSGPCLNQSLEAVAFELRRSDIVVAN